jgi:hypothetical protein
VLVRARLSSALHINFDAPAGDICFSWPHGRRVNDIIQADAASAELGAMK